MIRGGSLYKSVPGRSSAQIVVKDAGQIGDRLDGDDAGVRRAERRVQGEETDMGADINDYARAFQSASEPFIAAHSR